jgi:hypothetical protein
MTKPRQPRFDARRKIQFRETARHIVRMDRVKRQFGEAVDTAGAVARAMEQAYRLGFEEAVGGATDGEAGSATEKGLLPADAETKDAMTWTLIPPRTRNTFWSICLAALGRKGCTETPAYLEQETTRRGTLAWRLVVPDGQIYERVVGDGTIVTLIRLGLLDLATDDESRVALTPYGIKTWNRFCDRGGHWPDDLVEKLP